jgi:hypothetical protein
MSPASFSLVISPAKEPVNMKDKTAMNVPARSDKEMILNLCESQL